MNVPVTGVAVRAVSLDLRQVNSRARLVESALELVAEGGLGSASVTAVTANAGRSRSTFYSHAPTVLALIETALAQELEALYADSFDTARSSTAADLTRRLTIATLQHVELHEAIYRRAMEGEVEMQALQTTLRRVFADAIDELLKRGTLALPDGHGDSAEQNFLRASSVQYIAAGSVALIHEWLLTPTPRSYSAYLAAVAQLLPSWWPLEAESPAAQTKIPRR